MDYYYAKPGKNRQEGTSTVMMFLSCLIVAAINVLSNMIISFCRIAALLMKVTMNSLFTLILINPLLKWK